MNRQSFASEARARLRARVFLRAVLPLVERMPPPRLPLARWLRLRSTVRIGVRDSDVGATLRFVAGTVTVEPGEDSRADVRCEFADLGALNRFFAGALVRPHLAGALSHPLALVETLRLLASLRILQPQPPPARADERALRVRLLLTLVTRALAELFRGGHEGMRELVDESPERVIQWSVGDGGRTDGARIATYLRMERGRVKAGLGTYSRRQPFIHFQFRDVDSALSVLTTSGSQMDGVRSGALVTVGSPEYTRKIALLMQKLDGLLREG